MGRRFATLVCTVFVAGCSVGVELAVKNPEPFSQAVAVQLQKPEGGPDRALPPVVVEPHSLARLERFEVRKGGAFRVSSALPGSATLFSEKREVSGNADPVLETVELRHQAGGYLDDPQSLHELTAAFGKACPDAGAYPVEMGRALRTKLKSLVVLDRSHLQEIISLTAAQLGTGEATGKDIVFPDTAAAGEATLSGSALAQAGKSIPLYRSFRFVTEEDAVYRLEWLFEGFGTTSLLSNGEDIAAAFDRLSDTVKSQISDILGGNADAAVYYLDQAYVARRVRLSLQRGRVLGVGEEIRSGDVITGKGVYRFEGAGTVTREYRDVVLTFYGGEISVRRVPKEAGSAAVEGVPLRVAVPAFELTGYPTGTRRAVLPEYLRVTPAAVKTVH